jgi:hypothetical protein
MTALRLISLPLHGAFEMLVGFLVMAAPVALHMSAAAGVVGIAVGTLMVGLALSSTASEADGRRTMTISAHYSFDYGLAFGLLGSAAVLGLAGDRVAAAFFAVTALAQLALNLTTKYSHR